MKAIRNINFGWIIVLIGFVFVVSGFSMTTDKTDNNTFLCFERGCVYIQGISSIVVSLFSIGIGFYKIRKNNVL